MELLQKYRRKANRVAGFLLMIALLVSSIGCAALPTDGDATSESQAELSGTQEITITSITYPDPLRRDDLNVYFALGDESYFNKVHESWNNTFSDMAFVEIIYAPVEEEWKTVKVSDEFYQLTLSKTSFYTLEVTFGGSAYLIDIGPKMSYKAVFDGDAPRILFDNAYCTKKES